MAADRCVQALLFGTRVAIVDAMSVEGLHVASCELVPGLVYVRSMVSYKGSMIRQEG